MTLGKSIKSTQFEAEEEAEEEECIMYMHSTQYTHCIMFKH